MYIFVYTLFSLIIKEENVLFIVELIGIGWCLGNTCRLLVQKIYRYIYVYILAIQIILVIYIYYMYTYIIYISNTDNFRHI